MCCAALHSDCLLSSSSGSPKLLDRILKVQRSQLCYIVGTVYMDMPLKPNVLEDMGRDVRLRAMRAVSVLMSP